MNRIVKLPMYLRVFYGTYVFSKTKEIGMKKIIGVILCIVMSMSLMACNVQPRMGAGDIVLGSSASGGHELMLRDFLYFTSLLRSQHEQMLMQFGIPWDAFDDHWAEPMDETGRTMFDGVKENALDELKAHVVLYGIARSRGITYDSEHIAMVRAAFNEEVAMANSPDIVGARAFYEFYFVTAAERVEVHKLFNVIDRFQAEIFESIEVSDAQLVEFYNNPENADVIEDQRSLTVAHILLSFDSEADDIEANRTEVFEKAEEILERIQGGESFAALVVEYSQDPGSVENDGEYIITRNTNFVPEFLLWTIEAEIGELGIVETSHGVHIMNMVRRDSFEDMQNIRQTSLDGPLFALAEAVQGHLFVNELDRLLDEYEVDDWVIDMELFDSITNNIYDRARRR